MDSESRTISYIGAIIFSDDLVWLIARLILAALLDFEILVSSGISCGNQSLGSRVVAIGFN